jgi:HSP20 family protein
MKKDKKPDKKDEERKNDIFRINRSNSIFDAFENEFREMEERMNQFYRNALSGNIPRPEEGGPKIYGYTYRMGPDGKPHYQEFTNMDQKQTPYQITGEQKQLDQIREPLVDVQEADKEIYITVELPGAKKENIDLEVNNDNLTIKADDEQNFFKEVKLPAEVKTKNTEAKFNNGVLSITLKKTKTKKKGNKIDIE